MSGKNLPALENISKSIHTALRKWASVDNLELSPLKTLRIFDNNKTSSILTAALAELKLTNPMQFEILERRFVLRDAIKQVSLALHISEDHANRQQRDGIDTLAEILINQEHQSRRNRAENLLSILPPRTYNQLFGTEEVKARLFALLAKQNSPSVIAVTGLGGLGKTALADEVVRTGIEDFSYAKLIWIRVTPRFTVSKTFQAHLLAKLASKFSLQNLPATEQMGAIKKTLKMESFLLVVDNLDDEIRDPKWLDSLQEIAGPSKFLLTSRVLPPTLANVHVIKLSELEFRPATQFLVDHAQRVGLNNHLTELKDHAEIIYACIGGNPLALKLAVGLMHAWPLKTVLRSLEQGRGSDVEAMYKHVFEKSWQSISKDSQKMLKTMPLLGADGGSLEQLQTISGLTEMQTREVIKELANRSLVELRSSNQPPRYGIHRLTECFLRGQLVQAFDR